MLTHKCEVVKNVVYCITKKIGLLTLHATLFQFSYYSNTNLGHVKNKKRYK